MQLLSIVFLSFFHTIRDSPSVFLLCMIPVTLLSPIISRWSVLVALLGLRLLYCSPLSAACKAPLYHCHPLTRHALLTAYSPTFLPHCDLRKSVPSRNPLSIPLIVCGYARHCLSPSFSFYPILCAPTRQRYCQYIVSAHLSCDRLLWPSREVLYRSYGSPKFPVHTMFSLLRHTSTLHLHLPLLRATPRSTSQE